MPHQDGRPERALPDERSEYVADWDKFLQHQSSNAFAKVYFRFRLKVAGQTPDGERRLRPRADNGEHQRAPF